VNSLSDCLEENIKGILKVAELFQTPVKSRFKTFSKFIKRSFVIIIVNNLNDCLEENIKGILMVAELFHTQVKSLTKKIFEIH